MLSQVLKDRHTFQVQKMSMSAPSLGFLVQAWAVDRQVLSCCQHRAVAYCFAYFPADPRCLCFETCLSLEMGFPCKR